MQSLRKPVVSRPTAITLALKAALERVGIDTTDVTMPLKREPVWTVTRRKDK